MDGTGLPWFRGDLGIRGDRIVAIGSIPQTTAHDCIDASGKVVAPGFIDAHVHGDLELLADPLHEPAIRQGVTTYIIGQDGVAMAPGSPETIEYMRAYTAGFSGLHEPTRNWSNLGEYLDGLDRQCAVNVACLVPNGNVRMDAMGLSSRSPTVQELRQMRRQVRDAMEQGAIGLSSGLDYIPSSFAETEELIALCEEIAPFDGIYVTHMRAYVPERVLASMNEVFRIGRKARCGVHISHFNCRADLVLPHLDAAGREGVDATYDLYCYLAGSTILAMVALPPWVQEGGRAATLDRLRDPVVRRKLRGFSGPRGDLKLIRLSFIAAPKYQHLEGLALQEAAHRAGLDLETFICDVLSASHLAVGCIVPHTNRDEEDLKAMIRHPAMMAGSDGIYTGDRPHPRGWGCFARYLGYYVREQRVWTLEKAVQHLAAHAARRFRLTDRGLLRKGMAADVVVFDPETIADRATFENGRQLAVGVEHVVVNGDLVLRDGRRTQALPGRALRRS